MKCFKTAIPDIIIIQPDIFKDERGFFMELSNNKHYTQNGLSSGFVQTNFSLSQKSALRGLHYQIIQPQGKLVQVIQGKILDVAVDLRKSSKTFGQHISYYLCSEFHEQLFIPPGFAHGFLVMSDSATVVYSCTDFYAPEYERTLRWDDPDLKIEWPIQGKDQLIISEKDRKGKFLNEAEIYD